MTECQGCGAWNDTTRSVCVLCGTPLAGTDEWDAGEDLPPLPPLPDGGLSASMPAWLRELPHAVEDGRRKTEDGGRPPPSVLRPPSSVPDPLGPRADPRTFLTDDDFPQWLRDLAARAPAAAVVEPAMPDAAGPRPPDWPDWPGLPAPISSGARDRADASSISSPADVAPPLPALDGRPPAATVAARALEERRARSPWETLLLVILFIGVIVAALWALVSNGVFSPSL